MDKKFVWTVDVEHDWGGRTNGILGITEGLPLIIEIFRSYGVKALFFVSSELALDNRGIIQRILDKGHEIGSHGHFHIKYKDPWRSEQDRQISERLLSIFTNKKLEYRAPWFSHEYEDSIYSRKRNHVSVLKQSWFGGKIHPGPIFYIHPFDIVEGKNAPNLFCRLLYSKPRNVYNTFVHLVRLYSQAEGQADKRYY